MDTLKCDLPKRVLTGGKSVELGSDSAIYQLCDLGQLIDLSEPQVLHE